VHAVLDAGCDLVEPLQGTGLRVRALSYDVRRSGMVPEAPGRQFSLYLGTGGPGHIDPRQNDGIAEWSQGTHEDPAWEGPAFRLFDAVAAHDEAALLGVCHTFGVMSRWAGAAEPVLRSKAKGKSTGILENILTSEAREHRVQAAGLRAPDGRRWWRTGSTVPGGPSVGRDTHRLRDPGPGGLHGEGVTMLQFARDRDMP
jgi:hypothetical protein